MTEQSTSNEKVGEYLSLAQICAREGGGDSGLKAAINYTTRAVELGGAWVSFNEMTQVPTFMYFRTQYRDSFKKAWSLHETWTQEITGAATDAATLPDPKLETPTKPADANTAAADNENTPSLATPKGKAKAKAAGKAAGAKKKPVTGGKLKTTTAVEVLEFPYQRKISIQGAARSKPINL